MKFRALIKISVFCFASLSRWFIADMDIDQHEKDQVASKYAAEGASTAAAVEEEEDEMPRNPAKYVSSNPDRMQLFSHLTHIFLFVVIILALACGSGTTYRMINHSANITCDQPLQTW